MAEWAREVEVGEEFLHVVSMSGLSAGTVSTLGQWLKSAESGTTGKFWVQRDNGRNARFLFTDAKSALLFRMRYS